MKNALIGHTGFVGSTLKKQWEFDALYRSTDIGEIAGRHFETVICAGAPAQKWIANRDPDGDRLKIEGLIAHLKTISCDNFVLISTVDVFLDSRGADEESEVQEENLHAYGLNRRLLEKFVASHFSRYLIVRLPGLVGPGLRKNIIFDFLNENNLDAVESRGIFQFYPMVNLRYDIDTALKAGLNLVHLTAEPVSVAEVAAQGFGREFRQQLAGAPARYDLLSIHAALFGGRDGYQYGKRETIQAIRTYAQSEPHRRDAGGPKPV